MMQDNHKIIFIVGLGKSGYWAAKYLRSLGKSVIIIESKNSIDLIEIKTELEDIGVKVFLNTPFHYKEFAGFIKKIESIVISPGINLENKTIISLKRAGIKIIGEVNIGWNNLQNLNWVGVTGTNGKSTVTHLLSHILLFNNVSAPCAGNIGIPLCKYAYDILMHKQKIDWIIAELSSYQLEIAKGIKPDIGIWTTFTADHLERHKTIRNYFDIKNNLLLKSKYRIYNYDDNYLRGSKDILKRGIWVTTQNQKKYTNECDYWLNQKGYVIEKGKNLFNIEDFNLKGNHNIQNLLLATAAARKIGLKGGEIKNSLLSYEQLPHRLETIYKSKSLEIINDSKATNFASSIAGINSIKGIPIIICGGIIKNEDSESWVNLIKKRAHSVFLYGQNANSLKSILIKGGFIKEIYSFNALSELTDSVIHFAQQQKVRIILFSPSCSSFDQFRNYEERGTYFKSLIDQSLNGKVLR